MRTNIVLDDQLVAEASRLTGITTKRELVHEALRMLIQLHRRQNLLDLKGRITLADNYDYKAARVREKPAPGQR